MRAFCIPIGRINNLKKVFSKLDSSNKMGDLVKRIEKGEGVSLFSKSLPKEEAILLNRTFEKAIASRRASALVDVLRKNLDVKYRNKLLNSKQRQSISGFIERNLFPNKGKSEIIPIKEILKMSDKEKTALIKKTFGNKFKKELISDFKKAEKALKERLPNTSKIKLSPQEIKNRLQRKVLDNFLNKKKKAFKRISIPIKDILKMSPEKRMAFLKDIMPKEKAIEIGRIIENKQKTILEKDLSDQIKNFKSLKRFNNFIERKMDFYAGIKNNLELTDSEVSRIMNKGAEISKLKKELELNPSKAKQLEYGNARVEMIEIEEKLRQTEKETLGEKVLSLVGIHRAVFLGIDFATTLIQGAGIITEKAFWRANLKGIKNAFSEASLKESKAMIMGDGLYDLAKGSGLRIPITGAGLPQKEEAAMWLPFRNAFKSKIAKAPLGVANEALGFFERYVSSLSIARFDIWKEMATKLEQGGIKLDSKEGKEALKSLSATVNSISGSSNLGRFEKNTPELNVLLFSARLLASKLRMVASPAEISLHYAKRVAGKTTIAENIANKKKLRALLGIVAASGSMIALAKATGKDVETDTNSSSFGKMKIGNRYQDLTFGYGKMVSTISQLVTGKTKNREGVVKRIVDLSEEEKETEVRARDYDGAKIGRGDIVLDFFKSKLATAPSLIWDIFSQEVYGGGKPTVKGELIDKARPLFFGDFYDIIKDESLSGASKSFLIPFTFIGSSGSTREPTDWGTKDTVEMSQFRKELGADKLREAGKEYDRIVTPMINAEIAKDEYKKMTNKEKDSRLKEIKSEAKQETFSKFNFSPD